MVTDKEMKEYENYYLQLSPEMRIKELEWIEAIGKAKKSGKNVVIIDHEYDM